MKSSFHWQVTDHICAPSDSTQDDTVCPWGKSIPQTQICPCFKHQCRSGLACPWIFLVCWHSSGILVELCLCLVLQCSAYCIYLQVYYKGYFKESKWASMWIYICVRWQHIYVVHSLELGSISLAQNRILSPFLLCLQYAFVLKPPNPVVVFKCGDTIGYAWV